MSREVIKCIRGECCDNLLPPELTDCASCDRESWRAEGKEERNCSRGRISALRNGYEDDRKDRNDRCNECRYRTRVRGKVCR